MELILWTCGWTLVVAISDYLSRKGRMLIGLIYEKEKTEKIEAINQIFNLAIFVIGVIKFW